MLIFIAILLVLIILILDPHLETLFALIQLAFYLAFLAAIIGLPIAGLIVLLG